MVYSKTHNTRTGANADLNRLSYIEVYYGGFLSADLYSKILDAPPPLLAQIYSFSCSFWENFAK